MTTINWDATSGAVDHYTVTLQGVENPPQRPPREDLYRAVPHGPNRGTEVRREGDGMPTLYGHFAVFNEWTEIDSFFEGRFLERIAPGAFKKTFQENRNNIRVLFQHGYDPQVGDKVLGAPDVLKEDRVGGYYEVPLLDTAYNREILPGIEAGQYGASFRFRVIKEEFVREPQPSDYNPEGLPERTILEASVQEFGPVTFPAYPGATAQARSLTDAIRSKREPVVIATPERREPEPSTPTPEPARATPAPAPTRKTKEVDVPENQFHTVEEMEARMADIVAELEQIETRSESDVLSAEDQATWDERSKQYDELKERAAAWRSRKARLQEMKKDDQEIEPAPVSDPAQRERSRGRSEGSNGTTRNFPVRNLHDLREYRNSASSVERQRELMREGARRIVERATLPAFADEAATRSNINRLLDTVDIGDEDDIGGAAGSVARRIIVTGSERYRSAFQKVLRGDQLQPEEQRALSLTGAAGGFAVPFTLDPTILNTSNGATNPIRQIATVRQITGDEWRGVSTAGITASYSAEATETTDNSPTLTQPVISTEKAQAFVPYSIEVGQDWGALENDMAELLADAKDTLEAQKFVNGTGTNEPFGVLTGVTNTVNAAAGADAFTLANLYALVGALPPRYRNRASFLGDLLIYNRIRQFDTAGSSAAVWVEGLQADNPARLFGKPAYEASEMPNDATTGNKFLVFGDFSRYYIIERVGLNIETIPHLFGANRRPTGERGLYAYWRNGAKVVDANAFRALIGTA